MAAAAALAPDYIDIEDAAHDYNHNTSSQRHVVVNDDPVLRKDREHHHGHLHHSANTEKGREDDLAYSKGTTFEESTIPHQDPQDHNLHRRHHADNTKEPTGIVDPEHGRLSSISSEEDPQSHGLSSFYSKYRMFFHLFIWLLFTG